MTWRRTRLKFLAGAPICNGLGEAGAYDDPSWPRYIRTTDIAGSRSLRADVFKSLPPSVAARALLRDGDLLLTAAGATIGKSYLHSGTSPACFAGYLVRFRAGIGVDPGFIAYWTESKPYWDQIRTGAVRSTIDNFSAGKYQNLILDVPSFEEQRRIADFLDVQSAKVDGVIEARRRQLRLLEERELSRIFAAVGGVDEPGDRKRSGLRWLGDVPEDWPVLSVSSQFEVLLGKMLNQERVRGEHLRPYLRNTNVQWGRVNTEDLLAMDFPPHERTRYEVRVGDLLICEGGQPGRSAIWDGTVEEIYYQKALHRARSRGRSSVRWLFYCLRAATALDVFTVEGNTTTIGHLTGEQLRAHRFPFPDRHVQDRLVGELDAAAVAAQRAQATIRKQVELLTERRQALITAAITGQIDVRTARGVEV